MSTSNETVVQVEHISKDFILPQEKITSVKGLFLASFKRRRTTKAVQHALRDVSFEVKKGEFFGIVGRNGSGKSTMLKMLAGIYQPTKGQLHVEGKLVPFIELGVGFNPELTGRENVYLNGAMMGFSQGETDAMYHDIVSFAELEPFMDQKLKNYSSGMQVRLAFSVAIRAQAVVLLVDEVLAVGDADFQRKCYQYFKYLKRQKKTVIFVTHDMNAVREFCDRALLIEASKLVAIGKASHIASQYSRLFIGQTDEEAVDTSVLKAIKDASGRRWGDGAAKITQVKVVPKLLNDQTDELRLLVTVRAERDVDDLVTGFVVKDGFGTEICGTNTQVKRIILPALTKGETCSVAWTCPNIFADGSHTIDVAVHRTDGVTVHDWWEEAASFIVKRIEKTAYRIMPPIEAVVTMD